MTSSADSPRDSQETPSLEQSQELGRLLMGYRVSQALHVAAKLGIADLVADGPRGSDELARVTETHEGALYRMLRFLAGAGLFQEVAPCQFGLTPLGRGLRTGVPGSVRPFALLLLDDVHWAAWGELLHSVRTGETAFAHVHGIGFFDYFAQHPDRAAVFNAAMTSSAARSADALVKAYDFSGIQRLVDVGGGHGLLLATILRAYPGMHGVLFDRPEVVAGAMATLEAAGVAGRCEITSGDFFTAVPPGGDAYLLRQIIHDWDDAQATAILQQCRRAMPTHGRVLVVERAIASDHPHALPVLHLDLEMLVNLGGLQRTDDEYRELFEAAGFRLTTVVPLGDADQFSVFEGAPTI